MHKSYTKASFLGLFLTYPPKLMSKKLSLILIMAGAFHASAETHNHRGTLKKKNTPISFLLQDIQQQSGNPISYESSLIPDSWNASLNMEDDALKDALMVLLADHVDFNIGDKEDLLNSTNVAPKNRAERFVPRDLSAQQQQHSLTGMVKTADGSPMANVSVMVKNASSRTMTDEKGAFQLLVSSPEAILVFSSVGYLTQEITAPKGSTIAVVMTESFAEMDEVVVVGYGEQKKVNLTGAVSQISGEEFEDRPVTQLTQALQGNVPNLNIVFGSGKPGTSGSVNVRGNTSINGGGPLILIDGILGTLDRVNVNDVESVTVLKDASAAAVYGARGAFGVILVTTKKGGKDGQTNITYNSNFGLTTHATNTDYITSGYWNAKLNDDAMYNALGYRATRYSDEDYEQLLARVNDKTEHPDRPWVVVDKDASGKDMYRYYANFDWFNYLYDDFRPKSDNNLSFTGKTGNTSYALSGGISNEQGLFNIQPDKFKRYNFRANISSQVRPWLTISNGTHFFKSSYDWHGLATNFNQVSNNVNNSPTYHYHPMYVPQNPDGSVTGYSGINSYPIGYGLHNALLSGSMRGYDRGTEFTNKTEAIINLGKGLSLTGNYSYREFRSDYSYRQTRQYFSKYPGVSELSSLGALNQDRLTEHMSNYNWHFINVFANYQKSFGKHNLTAMAGFNQEDRRYKRVGGVGQELLSENLNDLNLVIGDKQFSGGSDEWALRGGFYRLNYDYEGKYLFETSGRYDGTSRFPKSSRFGFFPSLSMGWRISEEAFFEPAKRIVNNLKLRYSYGSLGNQEVSTYAYISSMGTGQLNYLVDGQRLNATYDPAPVANSLTWEKISTSNFGVDVAFLNNKLSLEMDYYIRNTVGMLSVGQTLPDVFGAAEPRENAADLRTQGFDMALSWRSSFQLGDKPFHYSVRGVFSDYTSEITKFNNPAGLLNTYYKGQQLGEIWGYRYDGLFQSTDEAQAYAQIVNQDQINRRRVQAPTAELRKLQAGDIKILDLNGDGVINQGLNTLDNPGDRERIGNAQPRFAYGLTLTADWNGIDASIFLQGIGRRHWYPNLEAQGFWSVYARPYDSFIPTDFPDKIWSPENPNAYFPVLRGYTAQNSELSVENDMYLQNLAYLKLRNLTIGYTLPSSITDRVGIHRFRVFATGENLHTWTKLDTDYLDPEQVMTDDTGRGYPMGKVYSFGVQLSF